MYFENMEEDNNWLVHIVSCCISDKNFFSYFFHNDYYSISQCIWVFFFISHDYHYSFLFVFVHPRGTGQHFGQLPKYNSVSTNLLHSLIDKIS